MKPLAPAVCVSCEKSFRIGENGENVCELCGGELQPVPMHSVMCLALVKPGSTLAKAWGLEKPGYCIYEYSKAFGTREIRWGDGSSQQLSIAEHGDLILLEEYAEYFLDQLFG